MLRSLYSGVSGMKNLQTKMDVVSNNIANVNTVGFQIKSGTFPRHDEAKPHQMQPHQEMVQVVSTVHRSV